MIKTSKINEEERIFFSEFSIVKVPFVFWEVRWWNYSKHETLSGTAYAYRTRKVRKKHPEQVMNSWPDQNKREPSQWCNLLTSLEQEPYILTLCFPFFVLKSLLCLVIDGGMVKNFDFWCRWQNYIIFAYVYISLSFHIWKILKEPLLNTCVQSVSSLDQ